MLSLWEIARPNLKFEEYHMRPKLATAWEFAGCRFANS